MRYGQLREDDVVAAALIFARREGLDRLTMRRLAEELGVSSTDAYSHVLSKRELFDRVADAVLAEVPAPDPSLRWDDQLRILFESARRVLLRHPGVSDHLLARAAESGALARAAESGTLARAAESGALARSADGPQQRRLDALTKRIMADAEFDPTTVNRAQRSLTYLLLGAVSQELAGRHDPAAARFADDEETFRFGLDMMLQGLRVRLRRTLARPG